MVEMVEVSLIGVVAAVVERPGPCDGNAPGLPGRRALPGAELLPLCNCVKGAIIAGRLALNEEFVFCETTGSLAAGDDEARLVVTALPAPRADNEIELAGSVPLSLLRLLSSEESLGMGSLIGIDAPRTSTGEGNNLLLWWFDETAKGLTVELLYSGVFGMIMGGRWLMGAPPLDDERVCVVDAGSLVGFDGKTDREGSGQMSGGGTSFRRAPSPLELAALPEDSEIEIARQSKRSLAAKTLSP